MRGPPADCPPGLGSWVEGSEREGRSKRKWTEASSTKRARPLNYDHPSRPDIKHHTPVYSHLTQTPSALRSFSTLMDHRKSLAPSIFESTTSPSEAFDGRTEFEREQDRLINEIANVRIQAPTQHPRTASPTLLPR